MKITDAIGELEFILQQFGNLDVLVYDEGELERIGDGLGEPSLFPDTGENAVVICYSKPRSKS